MAKDYSEMADKIVGLVGGVENVSYFTHCVTRLRFNLKDKSKANVEQIKKLPGAVGAQWSGEQLQIIIGQSVGDAYDLICKKSGLATQNAVNENLDAKDTGKKFSFNALLDGIAGCITPLIPMLIGCGMVKVVVLLCELLGILQSGSPTHTVLTFVGDAGFYFLPILAGSTSAKKFGANPGLGMVIGAILVHPTLVASVSAGESLSVFGIPIYSTSYTSTIFPVILSVFVMSYIEKFVAKHSPDAVRSITEPLFTILIMTPITLCLTGPLGAFIGNFITDAIIWLYNTTGFVGVALLGALYQLLVLTGMHTGLSTYLVQSFATLGYDPIVCTSSFLSTFSQGGANLAVAFKSKNVDIKSTATTCAITAIFGGVTEPALFGVSVKYKTPLYGAMAGGFAGGLVAGLLKVYIWAFPGSGGLFGLPAFIGGSSMNVVYMVICSIISIIVSFAVTFVLYKDEQPA